MTVCRSCKRGTLAPGTTTATLGLIRDYEAGRAFDDLVRRPPLPPGKTAMDMRAETPRA